ncbi:YjaG family protein [Algicola sagamiensis]|uniref:YjaG family protein n=1 Tax=Algicola sagamiensis TaxID=163869 RepID=UPI00036F161E|nr:YjaG family protein [Algicola sagamiensis]
MTQASKRNNFQRIRALPIRQQRLLSLALLERMLPNYKLFSEATQFGEYDTVQNCLDLVWEAVSHKSAKINHARLEEKLEELVPEPQDFDLFAVYPAVDALTGFLLYLQSVQNEEMADYVSVAKISQASVARLIEAEVESYDDPKALNQIIREHPLMQWEMDTLEALLDALESVKKADADFCQQLRADVMEEGLTNLGLEV